uniref:NAD(P)H dehydrogenase, quinone 1 n=1 Tax=Poecilia reticulata TaxID=8081 RepID=A0A3P9NW21_POERE
FNAALRDAAVQELSGQGFRVTVSDLYAMNFRASATQDDIIAGKEEVQLLCQRGVAFRSCEVGPVVGEMLDSLPHLPFPLYWFSVPAVLKGWFDRVLTQGFAFSLSKIYSKGVFKDKKVLLSFTTGAPESMFQPDGIDGDINVTLWPLQHGILNFCGFQVLAPQIFWDPAHCPAAKRAQMLDGWRARLGGLLTERPLTFAPRELFDLSFQAGFRLRPEVKEEQKAQPFGLSTGHHLGKPLPPDDQTRAPSAGGNKK